MPTPPPSRPPWRVFFAVLGVFVVFGVVARLSRPDATGRAIGGQGCRDDGDPEARATLEDQLDAQLGDPSRWQLPRPPTNGDWSAFPQIEANPLTDAKVALGKALFYEPGLMLPDDDALKQSASCGSCHDPEASFGSGTVMGRGLGSGGQGRGADRALRAGVHPGDEDLGPFNERRIVNIAFNAELSGWQGDFSPANVPGLDGLEAFLLTALISHGAVDPPADDGTCCALREGSVLAEGTYDALFAQAYPSLPADTRISRTTVALALAAYVRSITTWDAPFQRYLRGESYDDGSPALSEEALRGGVLFFGEGRCSACHTGPALAAPRCETIGTRRYDPEREYPGFVPPDPAGPSGWGTLAQYVALVGSTSDNRGHYVVSGDEADKGAFLVPSVYGAGNPNVLAFGHGGYHTSLADFIAHKVGGNDPTKNLSLDPDLVDALSPVLFSSDTPFLSDAQVTDLVAFIEEGLEDQGLAARHEPAGHLSLAGFCTPSNDPVSRAAHPQCANARSWTVTSE